VRSPLIDPLESLADAWRGAVRTPRRRAILAVSALAILVALLVARQGTTRARIGAVCGLGALAAMVFAAAVVERRVWRDPARVIDRLAGRVDPDRARRALRALTLLGADGDVRGDGTSAELARLHVARTIAALPAERVSEGARRLGRALAIAGAVFGLAALGLLVARAWSVLEGADVLFARRGVAPVAMQWLDPEETELGARPPDYLHQEERRYAPFAHLALPRGTLLTFRGTAVHPNRRLSLTDGESEVPFVDDGADRLVARWPLAETVTLRVVARFGDVVIAEPKETEVTSIADAAPMVVLEGAPRQIHLASCVSGDPKGCGQDAADADGDSNGDIRIRYEATDDHGLREVHLVLRSGTREERRVLARLDGETRYDRGGHALRARDPFLKKSHAPVEVRVEAKDNDPLTGPKWGASEAITIIPPDVGEPEARRLDALRALRDALVDSLAWRIAHDVPREAGARRTFLDGERRGIEDDSERVETALTATYAGVRVPLRLQAMLRGQVRKLRDATLAEAKAPATAAHANVIKGSEKLVLVVDAVVRGLGVRDARDSARQLADVADELALGASQMARTGERDRGSVRMDASAHILAGGAKSLRHFGELGRDLGGIVVGDLSRVARAKAASDFFHGELAARDLAARLRQPDPSFGGGGGRSGRGGGESGGGRGTPGDGEEGQEPDEAQRAFNEAAQELERLAQDHAGQMSKVEQALNAAQSDEELKAMAEEAKKHAENVREAAKPLPSVGGGSDSWTSKGSAAKEHAEQMAKSLEQGSPADAVQSGHNALNALEEAKRIAARERWFRDHDSDSEKKIEDARKKLDAEVKWAELALETLRKKAAERAGKQLAQQGDEEEAMAERASKLGEKGRDTAGLPQPALESLDDAEKAAEKAAQALKRGDAERAMQHQREAQRKLEMAKQALGDGQEDGQKGEGDDGPSALDHADIPKADAHKGPEEFRKRVIKGLGQPSSGRLKDAVRRYAEGLLR
jgi:hypothetical protein